MKSECRAWISDGLSLSFQQLRAHSNRYRFKLRMYRGEWGEWSGLLSTMDIRCKTQPHFQKLTEKKPQNQDNTTPRLSFVFLLFTAVYLKNRHCNSIVALVFSQRKHVNDWWQLHNSAQDFCCDSEKDKNVFCVVQNWFRDKTQDKWYIFWERCLYV